MLNCPQTHIKVEEEVPLSTVAGSGEAQNNDASNPVIICCTAPAASCRNDEHHRKLAICSIICGLSCIGIKALTNSVKAEQAPSQEAAERFLRQAKKFGIISIVVWVSLLVLIPVLTVLISYLLTLKD